MAKKPTNWKFIIKALTIGTVISVGGPAFTWWLTPSEEEIRSRYNPDLRKRSLENQQEKQQEFEDFVVKLKEYSKSDKPIWIVAKEEEERIRKQNMDKALQEQKLAQARREEMQREAGLSK